MRAQNVEWLIQAHIHSYLNSVLSQVDTDPHPLQDTAHTGSYESQVIASSKSLMCHVALRHILLSSAECSVWDPSLWMIQHGIFFEKFKNTFIEIYVWKTKQVLTRITWNKSARVRPGRGEVRTGENSSLMGFKWSPTWFCQKSHNQMQGDQFTSTKFTKNWGMIQNTSLLTDRGK